MNAMRASMNTLCSKLLHLSCTCNVHASCSNPSLKPQNLLSLGHQSFGAVAPLTIIQTHHRQRGDGNRWLFINFAVISYKIDIGQMIWFSSFQSNIIGILFSSIPRLGQPFALLQHLHSPGSSSLGPLLIHFLVSFGCRFRWLESRVGPKKHSKPLQFPRTSQPYESRVQFFAWPCRWCPLPK